MGIKVELLDNRNFGKIIGSGQRMVVDIPSRLVYNVNFAGPRNDHYDVTHATERDAKIAEQALGRAALDQWRARPVVVRVGDRWVALGLCQFMHHIRIGGGNPGPRYISRNESGPPWSRNPMGGHVCAYLTNSIGGAGNGDNPAVSTEANKLAGNARGRQARAACFEAHILGNRPSFLQFLDGLVSNQKSGILEDDTVISTGQASSKQEFPGIHIVKSGDTMTGIARRYGITLQSLIRMNPQILDVNRISIGQRVNISTTTIPPIQTATHTVVRGETMSGIASRHSIALSVLVAANPQISDINRIIPGQRINLPI